jgi:hypothetical protein
VDILVFLVLAVVLPVVINKTTERGYFHWVVPYLRPIWTAILAILSIYILAKATIQEAVVNLHPRIPGVAGYLISAAAGAMLLCAYWWLTGKVLNPPQQPQTTHPTEMPTAAPAAEPPKGPRTMIAERSDAVSKLAELGWTVKPGATDIEFEVTNKQMPDGQQSAFYFRKLHKPFRLHFQSVKGIAGLHSLSDIAGCTKIEINAGEMTDIGELRGFKHLKILGMSQTPINGLSIIDISPISSMTDLRELNLGGSKVTDVTPISGLTNLRVLNLYDTPVRDLSPLSRLVLLESLEIRATGARDMSVLAGMKYLRELGIDGKQGPDLTKLSHSKALKILRIIDQGNVDLSSVGQLTSLESLFVWGPPRLDLSPLHTLTSLRDLHISGLGVGNLSAVTGLDALGKLAELQKLTLGSLAVSDLTFVSNLKHLTEINIGMMPVSSIEPLRGLASLTSVSLNLTSVVDISPLLDLPALKTLSVIRTPARADVLTQLERSGVKIQR